MIRWAKWQVGLTDRTFLNYACMIRVFRTIVRWSRMGIWQGFYHCACSICIIGMGGLLVLVHWCNCVHFAHLCIVNRTCALLSVPVYHFEGTTSTVVYKVEVTVDEEEDDDFPSRLIASQVATAAASSKERCYTYDKSCTYDTCPILRGCDQRETSSRDAMETWAWAGAVSCFSRPHLLSKTTFFFTLSLLFFSDEQNHPQSCLPNHPLRD
jgi:hypothetical protein